VYEVDLDGKVINIKSLARPSSDLKKHKELQAAGANAAASTDVPEEASAATTTNEPIDEAAASPKEPAADQKPSAENVVDEDDGEWHERFDTTLKAYLSDGVIEQIKNLYLEGPEPPFVSDAGWEGRKAKPDDDARTQDQPMDVDDDSSKGSKPSRGRGKGRGGGRGRERGARGGRGAKVDTRRVVTDVSLLLTMRIHELQLFCPCIANWR
jgi:tRNA pseudouridine13 synthase